ncbi:MAG: Ger(x)C family spore germination protein [Oscillospiraceae bacterium]|jgi:spore germination protein KC|nr:Ger(x)C family spore germination protein [Oscillospiraceae bacterium]
MSVIRVFAAAAAVAALCSGCMWSGLPRISEIEQFEIIRVVGIDADTKTPGNVEVTFLTAKPEPASGGEQADASMSYAVVSSAASTALEAIRDINMHSDKRQHLGYIDYYIIGERAAREDIAKYTDFLMRDHETRYSSKVYIARGTSARELISDACSSDRNLEEALDNMAEVVSSMSNTSSVRVIDLINMLDYGTMAAVLPALRSDAGPAGGETGGAPDKVVVPAGYAILRDGGLEGFLEPEYARGYNFLTNRVESCPVSVDDGNGGRAGFEVVSADTRVSVQFDDRGVPISVEYASRIGANIAELQSDTGIFADETRDRIASNISDAIRGDMESVIDRSLEIGLDCMQLGERVRMTHPIKWKNLEDNWRDVFPSLEITVNVDTEILRVYSLREPNGTSGIGEAAVEDG